MFPSVIWWLTWRHEETIDYVIVQTQEPFHHSFKYRTSWKSQKIWTMNTQILSIFELFQSFSHECKKCFPSVWPNGFVRFRCECLINLLKRNLQIINKNHVAKLQCEIRLLSVKRLTWKQKRDILASENDLQLIKVITYPANNHFSWYGAGCLRSCFCVQETFDYTVSYIAKTSKVSTFRSYHVPHWLT